MSASVHAEIRVIPLEAIVLSETPIQKERRAQFNQQALKELADTIKAAGRVEHAITVRPISGNPDGEYEVADGERRVLATEMAGHDQILAEVRELTDEQVEQMQIVTGLQKEGLHELVEAEGYETLQKRGLTVDEIATKCGRSKATVYARMKLLDLCPEARKAVRDGKISASVGLLLARIPLAKLQKEVLPTLTGEEYGDDEPMSYREASQFIQREYMLRLDQAPFPTDDATLVKKAGVCGICPKNTSAQPELFADVSTGAMCTDQTCFASKKSAYANRQLDQADEAGQKVIRGADAKRIAPGGTRYSLKEGWVALDTYAPGSNQTVGKVIGKDVEPALLQLGEGEVVKVVQLRDVKAAVKQAAKKSKSTSAGKGGTKEDSVRVARAHYAETLFATICAKVHRLERWLLDEFAIRELAYGDLPDIVLDAFGIKGSRAEQEKAIRKLSDATLHKVLMASLVDDELDGYNKSPTRLLEFAKRYKVNPDKVREDIAAVAEKAKTAAKAAKKKAARK